MTTTCLIRTTGDQEKGKQEELVNSVGLNSVTLSEHVNKTVGIRYGIQGKGLD